MLEFFSGCAGLFNKTFNATFELEFFRFLDGLLLIQVCIALFLYLYHGTKRL